MTVLFLVRCGDDQDPPPGAVGRVLVGQPARYAYVKDEAAFTAWAKREGRVGDCGHPTQAFIRVTRDRALAAWLRSGVLPPPGIEIRQEEEVPLAVYPVERHAGELAALLWESPTRVVRSRPAERKRRAKRRARWAR